MSRKDTNYTKRIMQMARDVGVSIIEVAAEFEWESPKASSRLCSLARQGRLVKAIPVGSTRARYYLVAPVGAVVEQPSEPVEEPQTSIAASTPPWRHDQPLTVTKRGGITVTIGPSTARDPRFQVGKTDDVWGAGFSAAGIGRDVVTGKAWEERK